MYLEYKKLNEAISKFKKYENYIYSFPVLNCKILNNS